MKTKTTWTRRALALCMSVLMLMTAWVFVAPTKAAAASTWDGSIGDPGAAYYYTDSSGNYHLESAKALVYFINRIANGTDFNGKTVYLETDVDLASIDFGNNVFPYNTGRYFKGTFDGQNHTISNFKMTHSDHRIAMFRQAQNATFKNISFENVFIDDTNNNGKNGFAVLVGFCTSGSLTFDNVHINSGVIYGNQYVGALVGEDQENSGGNITITNCSNGARIEASGKNVGGLVGRSLPAVYATNCTNTGNVTSSSTDVGGIVGWIEDDPSSFTSCTNEGNVQGSDAAGGIVGYFGSDSQDKQMTLINNVNRGNITATGDRAGGIAGHLVTDYNAHVITGNVNYGNVTASDDTGGIIGRNKGFGVWENNKNYGNITSRSDNAGGIVGEVEDDKQIFTNCYNAGEINGKNSTGGIAGWLNSAAENEFTRCYNTGAITSNTSYAGGIEGRGSKASSFTECFNIGTVKGANDSGGIAGSIDYHSFYTRCFNAGSIGPSDGNASKSYGGMVGYTSYYGSDTNKTMAVDCYNWGEISGGYVGGLVGYVNSGKSYVMANCYNTGALSGSNATWQFAGYGGGPCNNCYKIVNTGSGTYKTSDEFETYDFTLSDNYCKNTWGVSINGTTYKYPILSWYRDLFSFEFNFVDDATGTTETILKNYGESFTVPNPTRSGYSAGQWLSGNTHRLVRGATVTAGNTYLTSTNFDKNVGPADTNTVVQSFTDPTVIRSTKTYGLIWNEGAAANMYATAWANENNPRGERFRAGIDYTIYNLTTGHDVSYTDNSATDYKTGNSQYFKSYQKDGTGSATATLEVDRSKMDDIKDTGIYIDYYPFIYTAPGGVRWGVEIFDPNDADSKGVLNNDYWTATVTGTSGKSYTYEQRFGDVNGNDRRCAETNSDFTQEPLGTPAAERRYGSYKWYFKGAAPDVGDSVTLRITAICAARHNSGNLQILSEWTDLTITGICSHSGGHLIAHAEKAVSCEEAGNSAYWECDVCHKYFSDAAATHEIAENSWVINATGHTPAEPVRENEVPATCTAEGSYDEVVYCSVCNEELSRETKMIDKIAHTPEVIPGKAATCTETGLTEGSKCSVCGEILTAQQPIEKLSHTPGEPVRENEVPATCTAEGSYDEVVYCTACNTEISRETKTIDKLAHTPEVIPGKAATCTETGLTEGSKCSVCDEILTAQQPIEKLAHTPGEPVRENEVPATCSSEGSYDEVVYCSVCNTELSRTTKTIEKLAHTPEVIPGKAATCTETGLTEGSKCSVCGEILTAQQPIEKLAHTPGEPVRENEVPATCSSEGSYDEVVSCSVCETELSRETKTIEKLQHKYTNYVFKNDATCTADGTETATCDFGCGTTDTRTKTGSKLGHSWGEWVVTKAATCTEEGVKTRTCARDAAHTETQAIAKKAHVDNNGDGKCDVCGSNTDVHQHTDGNHDNTCDTCGKTINTSFRCSMCDYNDQHRNTPVFGWFVIIIHFFVHLFAQMKAWV